MKVCIVGTVCVHHLASLSQGEPEFASSLVPYPQVPEFQVSMTITTDKFDALYQRLKPKGVTMTALLAKACGIALASHPILYACELMFAAVSWLLGWVCWWAYTLWLALAIGGSGGKESCEEGLALEGVQAALQCMNSSITSRCWLGNRRVMS